MNKNFTRLFIKKTAIICALLSLTACASGPRSVSASLPLVTSSMEKPDKKMVPEQYWPILADAHQSRLPHKQYQITLGAIYPSALGLTCRELVFHDNHQLINKRIACENHFLNKNNKADKGWFLEKEIIESSHYVEM
ncbi:MAG: hypothetical protein ACJAZP_000177 [Psychromonas sp.]|jgi:hypothetical protein|uniref:hypothetical protein n=1 Tax=Psychromonas sp. TaxID=1884585 RepID=UPI0039E5CBF1